MTNATIAGLAAVLIGAECAAAQTPLSDVQVWPSVVVTAPVGSRLEIRADGLLQVTDDVSRVGRELLRVVAIGAVNEHLALGGGYTWTRTGDLYGHHVVEQRAVQQVDVRIPFAQGAAVVSFRTRMEERRQERASAMAFRLREQIRLDVAVARHGLRAVVWSEYFHAFNGTAWSGAAGPALVLAFVGVHIPVSRSTSIEPGYLNQTNFVGGRNQRRHVVAVLLGVRLPHP